MLFQLRNKSNFCQDLVKRTLIHRNVATTCVKLTGRPAKSFNQSDFDRVHRIKFDKFQKEIEEKSSEDPFSPVKYFVKALTYGFILATICSISYGEASVLLYFNIFFFSISIFFRSIWSRLQESSENHLPPSCTCFGLTYGERRRYCSAWREDIWEGSNY